ncbi:MAG TPA: hypothetical protein DHW49_00430 [Anaerolineae bacterium]|nr:hypothetical protein [Anaerolineae bacterium]
MNLDSPYKVDQAGKFFENAHITFQQNQEKIAQSESNADFVLIEELLNLQYDFASIYLSIAAHFVDYEYGLFPILSSAFYKNMFAFYASTELTKKGLYGPARSILRYIFESITIAKFCSVSRNQNLIQKWINEDHIGLSNDVINKIKSPDNSNLKKFLKPLNSFSHHTRSAQQVSFNIDENWGELDFNIDLLKVLLECNYHVLNVHIVNNSAIYYVKAYDRDETQHEKGKSLKKDLRTKFSLSKKNLPSEYKYVIRDFIRKWVVKQHNT